MKNPTNFEEEYYKAKIELTLKIIEIFELKKRLKSIGKNVPEKVKEVKKFTSENKKKIDQKLKSIQERK